MPDASSGKLRAVVPARPKFRNGAPEVSVVIPTRNRAHFLPATISSALAAAAKVEVIVVDDASTDLTEEVCRGFGQVTYIRMPQRVGTSEARNVGIRESRCEYVAFLDDDDLRLAGSIDRQLPLLKHAPRSALVCGRAFWGDHRFSLPTGTVIPAVAYSGDVFWPLLDGNFIQMPTVVARKQALLDCGLFDAELDMLEDYDLWVRMAQSHSVEFLDEPVAVVRKRSDDSGQKTSNRSILERQHKALHKGWLNLPRAREAPPSERRRVHRRHMRMIYNSLISDAATALLDGNVAAARSHLHAAVRLSPSNPKGHGSLIWLHLRKHTLHYGDRLKRSALAGRLA